MRQPLIKIVFDLNLGHVAEDWLNPVIVRTEILAARIEIVCHIIALVTGAVTGGPANG